MASSSALPNGPRFRARRGQARIGCELGLRLRSPFRLEAKEMSFNGDVAYTLRPNRWTIRASLPMDETFIFYVN